MAISTRIKLLKPGVTLRTGTLPDRDWDLDEKADLTNVLARNNTDIYTPNADYHPSTKKYVDDGLALKADKTNVLELDNTTSFTPDADYEPSTKKYVDDGLATKKDDFTENTAFNQNFETVATEIKMNGTQALGISTNVAPADHVHPSDTSREPTFSKNTAFNQNFETIATEIKENGTQAVGSSSNVPRADHVHPKDTTKSDKLFTINAQTGTTYTLQLTDSDCLVTMSNASANTLTIPTNASVAFAVGTKINIVQRGVGITTIEGDTGVSLNGVSAGTAVFNGQFEGISIYKEATDSWIAVNK